MSDKLFLSFKDMTKEIPTPEDYNELLNSFLKVFEINEKKNYSFKYIDNEDDEIQLDDGFSKEELKDVKDNTVYIVENEEKKEEDENEEDSLSSLNRKSKSIYIKKPDTFVNQLNEEKKLIDNARKNSVNKSPKKKNESIQKSIVVSGDLKELQKKLNELKVKNKEILNKNKELNSEYIKLREELKEKEEILEKNEDEINNSNVKLENEFESKKLK